MTFSDKDILLASLLGSKLVQKVPRLALVENELQKRVLGPIPFMPFKNEVIIKSEEDVSLDQHSISIREIEEGIEGDVWLANPSVIAKQFVPLLFRRAGTDDPYFALPYEPLISITGKNKIVKRSIAKAPGFIGTIKERWSQDDYDIQITGALFGENEIGDFGSTFPKDDFEKLRDYCTKSEKGLEVQCDLFQLLGINFIVIEEFSFPFSKGENVQAYDIKAVSDFTADFLLELKE